MAMDLNILQRQLQDFAVAHYGESAVVSQVEVMPGHAGLSFGFRVDYQEAGQPRAESLVMRLPPKGVVGCAPRTIPGHNADKWCASAPYGTLFFVACAMRTNGGGRGIVRAAHAT